MPSRLHIVRSTRRTVLTAGLAVLTAPLLTARIAYAMDSPLRIGIVADLTGPLAMHGKHALMGMQYRAESTNTASDHGGHQQLELIVRDGASEDAATRDAVASLLEEGVHALLGSGKHVTEAASASCTPCVIPSDGPLPKDMPFVFQSGPSAQQVTKAMMRAVKAGGQTKASQVVLDKLNTPEAKQIAADEAAMQGVQTAEAQQIPATATDAKEQVAAAIAQEPEALLVNAVPPFDAMIVRDARAAGFTGPIVCSPAAIHPAFQSIAADGAEGTKAISPWLAAPDSAPDTIPHWSAMKRFTEGFGAANGSPGTYAGYGADAVTLMHMAFLGHRDRQMAQQQLEKMCCIGACGVYKMTADDHAGLDKAAFVPMTSTAGKWTPAP